MKVILECMHGLGDNVYQRVVARAYIAAGWEVWVRTVWPQIWQDLPVHLLPAQTELRTQKRNVEAYAGQWAKGPESPYERRHPSYSTQHFAQGKTIPQALLETARLSAGQVDFSLKADPEWVEWAKSIKPAKPLALVHPATVRTEWSNAARANDPKYMQQLIDSHPEYEWWEIQDVVPGVEDIYGAPLKGTRIIPGLTTEQLIGLMSVADVIVTCVGFMLPLGIALRTPVVCLYGGDIPDRLLTEPWMLGAPYAAVQPSPMCECGLVSRHRDDVCNKVLDPALVEGAFRQVACTKLLSWDDGYGYYPVHVNGQYNKAYFDKYANYEKTPLGEALNQFRVDMVKRHFGERQLVDIGPGSCQFVKATNALGYDINPATVEELKRLGRYVNPELVAAIDVATFWDSLEHLSKADLLWILGLIKTGCIVTLPIFNSKNHVLSSKHFRTDEHFHYWTHQAFLRFMGEQGFRHLVDSDQEEKLGREGVRTYVFERATA